MKSRKQHNKQSTTSGQIRIIGGKYRSRKLKVLDVEGLRPTTDRVKETVFNWLMPYTSNANVLDCFAGSGGLGFEALSRYAKQVHFIELNTQAHKQILQNISELKADNCEVLLGDSFELLPNLNQKFDLVFIDPPFNFGLANKTCEIIANSNLLAQDAVIYLETERNLESLTLPSAWQILKQKDFGQVTSYLIQT